MKVTLPDEEGRHVEEAIRLPLPEDDEFGNICRMIFGICCCCWLMIYEWWLFMPFEDELDTDELDGSLSILNDT